MRYKLASQHLNFRLKTVVLWQNVIDAALLQQTQNFSSCTTELLNFFPKKSPLPKTSETYSLHSRTCFKATCITRINGSYYKINELH